MPLVIVLRNYLSKLSFQDRGEEMTGELKINEIMLVILMMIGVACCIYFLIKGKKTAKVDGKITEFEKIALYASVCAMFLAQVTSAVGNYNVMTKAQQKTKEFFGSFNDGMVFDSSTKSFDYNDDTIVDKNEKSAIIPDELRLLVDNNPSIIFKEDIFLVEVSVRNVTEDERNNRESKEWLKSVNAEIGDIVEYQIHYKNNTSNHSENVMVNVFSPTNMDLVDDTTKLYSAENLDGLLYTDNNIDDDGINIGSYYPNADAYIRFREKIVDRNLVQGTNRLVLWGQVTNWIPEHEDDQGNFVDKKGETLQDNADVYVDK